MKDSMKKKLAEELYVLKTQIDALTEKAEEIKKTLRMEMQTKESVELDNGVICTMQYTINPVFDNSKLYKKLTAEEIVTATKPIVSELRKIFADQYVSVADKCVKEWIEVRCIKFSNVKAEGKLVGDSEKAMKKALDKVFSKK